MKNKFAKGMRVRLKPFEQLPKRLQELSWYQEHYKSRQQLLTREGVHCYILATTEEIEKMLESYSKKLKDQLKKEGLGGELYIISNCKLTKSNTTALDFVQSEYIFEPECLERYRGEKNND